MAFRIEAVENVREDEFFAEALGVLRIAERTIDKRGQALLVPEITLEGWGTSLDLDIERLPSGKFATNALVLACAGSYNILRWLGQTGLTRPGPVRHRAKRCRIRAVMQEIMYLAARFIETGRRLKLGFGRRCRAVGIFSDLYHRLAYG